MTLANCERCNRIFNKIKTPLCPECIEKEEDDFKIVNEALREQPNQTVQELAEKTGVSEKTILRLVRQERISSDSAIVDVKCGKCGAPAISLSVRLCRRCAQDMAQAAARACSRVGKTGDGSPSEGGDETVHKTYERKTGKA
jgi:uncharacterized protein YerC